MVMFPVVSLCVSVGWSLLDADIGWTTNIGSYGSAHIWTPRRNYGLVV